MLESLRACRLCCLSQSGGGWHVGTSLQNRKDPRLAPNVTQVSKNFGIFLEHSQKLDDWAKVMPPAAKQVFIICLDLRPKSHDKPRLVFGATCSRARHAHLSLTLCFSSLKIYPLSFRNSVKGINASLFVKLQYLL